MQQPRGAKEQAVLLGAAALGAGILVACPQPQVCISNRTGIWTGVLTAEGETLPIRFQLRHDCDGSNLSGSISFGDPVTGAFPWHGLLNGRLTPSEGTWTTTSDVMVNGTFTGEKEFSGKLTFPSLDGSSPRISADITLTRDG